MYPRCNYFLLASVRLSKKPKKRKKKRMTGKAFGVQSPTQGENAVSWQTWSNGSGTVPTILGDQDWGKLQLDSSGEEGRSAVYDLGSIVTTTFTLTANRYGSGSSTGIVWQLRGSTGTFTQDAVLPSWENYSAPISHSWRYVQVRGTSSAELLTISSDNRYLVDPTGNPVFLVGDSGWSAVVQLTDAEISTYLQDRANRGFNLVIVELIEHQFGTNSPNNIDNVPPFTGADFLTPNPTYMNRVDYLMSVASNLGIYVMLFPLYLGYLGLDEGWDTEVAAASTGTMSYWGGYVGDRYKGWDNLIWCMGGDADPAALLTKINACATGLKANDARHLITFHNAPETVGSTNLGSPTWYTLENIYTREAGVPSFCETAYAIAPTIPFFHIEGRYENDNSITPQKLRAEAYWTTLGGAFAHVFGNTPLWNFSYATGTWTDDLNTDGANSMTYMASFFRSIAWHTLVPDSSHTTLTVGYGTIGNADYAGCGRSADGSLVVIYMPSNRTMTVDMTRLSGTTICRWYDPTNGVFSYDAASPLPNTGTHDFSHAGANNAGAADWILILEA